MTFLDQADSLAFSAMLASFALEDRLVVAFSGSLAPNPYTYSGSSRC